jgi:hypothetical protein
MTESDAVLNAETRRALREWGRRLSAVGAGVLTAIVMLTPVVVTALRSAGLLFHLAVTLAVSLSLPVTAAYVGVRTYGLTHREAVYAAKYAVKEAAAATATLGEHQRVERPEAERHTETENATTPFADTDNDDTQ